MMPDRGMIVKCFEFCRVEDKCSIDCPYWDNNGSARECTKELAKDVLTLLKEQDNCENCAIAIEDRQPVVRCKDCIHRGKSEKCVLAAISGEKDYPLFMLDNRGEWFCADGEKEGR